MPHIRDAVDADGPALAALIAAIFADYDGLAFRPEEFPELSTVASHFARKGGRLLVAAEKSEVVGCFGVVPTHEPDVFEFQKVYLAHRARGKGLARRMLDEALELARSSGAERITLWSDLRFVEGHAFYRRHGFSRGAGVRALHDASDSVEINFRLDSIPRAA